MAKLYFRYGTVNSAKTLQLLAVAHNYQAIGETALVMKPAIDTRWGVDKVRARAGLERRADYIIGCASGFDTYLLELCSGPACILIDEAQFLERDHVDSLRYVSARFDIPVICYGLRCDFRGNMFEGSARLFEVADSIEEIKTVCNYCPKKAIMNLKFVDGEPTKEGPSIELGGVEKYVPACWECWYKAHRVPK